MDWIRMLSSGPMKIFFPSMWEWKYTPSSLILRSPARENTWNPPESVRIGLSQDMNLCRPPRSRITLSPGRTWEMIGVGKLHLRADPLQILRGHGSLDGGSRPHIHENRSFYNPVYSMEPPSSGGSVPF